MAEHNTVFMRGLMHVGATVDEAVLLVTLSNRVFRKARLAVLRDPKFQQRLEHLKDIEDPAERLKAALSTRVELRKPYEPRSVGSRELSPPR